MLETDMDKHLGYEKNLIKGNNSGNSPNGYGKKTITSVTENVKYLFRETVMANLSHIL